MNLGLQTQEKHSSLSRAGKKLEKSIRQEVVMAETGMEAGRGSDEPHI